MRIPPRLVSLFVLFGALPALAGAPDRVPGARSGLIVVAPDKVNLAERVTFDAATAPRLAAAQMEETLVVADWPVAPGIRAAATLTRHDVYSPDARVYEAVGDRLVELPRSTLVFFWGTLEGETGARAVAWVDPTTNEMEGATLSRYGTQAMRRLPGLKAREALVGPVNALSEVPLTWACSEDAALQGGPQGPSAPDPHAALPPPVSSLSQTALSAPPVVTAATHQMIVAFDTDNEFMQLKFSDNTTAATNYVAALVAVITPIYERDLAIKIVQGTLILRPSTTADPYTTNTGGNASVTYLNEFSSYWSANYGSVNRGLAQLLSGKQPGSSSASGIAWLHGLCSTSNGYSVAQVFKFAQQTASSDVLVNAHEMGHNFGSPHTHCPFDGAPPIDSCYNGEGGCYSGATSCPAPVTMGGIANVTGTLMSYCHLLGGCNAFLVFHPTTLTKLAPYVANAKTAGCITPLGGPPATAKFYTLTPCRVLDTRNATGPLGGPKLVGGGVQRNFTVTSACGIPATAKSISANVTITQPAAAGDLKIFPGDQGVPTATTTSFSAAGQTRANNATIGLASTGAGTIGVVNDGGATHFILDVNGYYQ